MVKSTRQPQDKYVLRLPDGMRDMLKEAAAENERSLNAEIVARLRSTLDEIGDNDTLLAAIRELVVSKRIAELFGADVAEGISHYATYVSHADGWNEALEELLRWSLIDAGILAPDEGETHPVSTFGGARDAWAPVDEPKKKPAAKKAHKR